MDEGAGDSLNNSSSNLQEQEKNEQSQQNEQSLSSSSSSQQQQQQQQQQQHQQPPLSSSSSSTPSTTTILAATTTSSTTTTSSSASSHEQQQQQSSSSSSSTSSSHFDNNLTTSNAKTTNDSSSANKFNSEEPNNDKAKQQQQQHLTNSDNNINNNNEHLPKRSPSEDLFSTKRWGTTPIRQDTPWELPPSPTQTNSSASSSSTITNAPSAATTVAAAAAAAALAGPIGSGPTGSLGNSGPTLPPGISQSGDSFRSGAPVNDFHGQAAAAAMVNNFGVEGMGAANGLANSLGHMNLGASVLQSSRFDQPWRAPAAKQHQPSMASSSPFANHNLMNSAPANSMQKSMLNSGGGGNGNGSGGFVGMQGNEFARAPGPASSIMDNNMTSKPFGMANRSSTWSAFGNPTPNEPEPEWPKTTTSGISSGGNSNQPSNAFDLVPEFEPGKSWHGSMLMKGLDDDSTINSGSAGISAFAGAYAASSKSPTGSQYEPSGIGTWSPIVKGGRQGSKWDSDGPDNGRGDNGRFDDGTAIWGSPAQTKVFGVDWVEKTGDANSNNDKSRSMAGNNQSYRPQQSSSSSASLLMSSNTSPSSQHNRNQQALKQPSLSHNFDQVQQQSNALSSQANQPNRGLGLSSNVPSTQQLKHMVQQIQLAVHAGHLNPQILNQPLAPVTLQLLYQLLTQIKFLHQLQATQQFSKPGNHPAVVNVNITKTKQSIINLQNQIASQQAIYLKQTHTHNISSRQPTMPSLATGGVGGGIGPALPPGISQSGDSFRSGAPVNDFHGQAAAAAMVNNFGVEGMGAANGLANSLGHMNLGASVLQSSRFDQPWRAPAAKQHQPSMASSSPFANHNLMNSAPANSMQKSMLNSGGGGNGNGSGGFVGMQGNEFARAPGPASSIMDNNMTSKPFGMANRSSTWSAFGNPTPNEPEPEWPKTTTSGISSGGNSNQPSNAFDLVPEFEPGKPWRGSMLMKSVEDDPTMTPGSMARSLAPQRKTIWSDDYSQ